jgi:hypothetical protein
MNAQDNAKHADAKEVNNGRRSQRGHGLVGQQSLTLSTTNNPAQVRISVGTAQTATVRFPTEAAALAAAGEALRALGAALAESAGTGKGKPS